MRLRLNIFIAVLMAGLPLTAFPYTASELITGSDGTVETIALEATVTESPLQINIKAYSADTFSIYRKAATDSVWGTAYATGVALSASGIWSDTSVSVGTLYEYKFVNTAGTAYAGIFPTGYILSGIKVDQALPSQTVPKGRLAVVVASDLPGKLPAEYAQYKNDLRMDGWTVHEIPVPRAANYSGVGNGALVTVKVNNGGTGSVNGDTVYLNNAAGKKAVGKLTASSGVITAVAVPTSPANAGGSGFAVNDVLTLSGGTSVGSGASLVGHIDPAQSSLASVNPITGGSGYTNGEAVTLTGQTSGKTAQCTLRVTSGKITGFTVVSSQIGFITAEPLTLSGNTTGSGIGNLQAYVFGGALNYVYIYTTGSGYVDGDAGTVTGNTSGKTAQVILDVSNGVITFVSVDSSETGFIGGETLTLSGTSAGSGAGLFTASYVTGPLQSISVNAGGTNYVNGNVVTINGGSAAAQGTLSVTGGAITAVSVTSGGAGFYDGFGVSLSGLQSAASGYNLTALTVDNSGTGRGVAVTAGGSGYRDNDSVTILGVTSGATATGSIIAPSGAVTSVSAVLPNTFTPNESLTIIASAGGSGVTATAGVATENHLLIRSAVQAVYNAYPGELKSVLLVGRVPVCRSGLNDGAGSDGHGNQAPYAADAFYADMDGVVGTDWTDLQDNSSSASANYNLPGDKQFDQQRIYQVGNGKVELGFGRIDLSNGFPVETEALRNYFNKLHRYKIASPDFLPGRRVGDRFSFQNVRETAIMSMPSVVGNANIETILKSAPPVVNGGEDPDAAYTAVHGPYLFYFKGGSGPLDGTGGKAVLWTGMQSHYGYWYDENGNSSGSNSMQKQLADDSFCLSWTWDIWGLRYIYHRMGMGFDAADMIKQSINNRGNQTTGTYSYRFNNTSNGDYSGVFYMNNMGDPALRLFMFAPPSKLSVVKNGSSNPSLSWIASPEPTVTGYHVYRKPVGNGPYTRLTLSPQPDTTYTDATVSAGTYTYMVRAIRLETSGGGTFYNPSLGIEQSLDLTNPPAAITITNTSLAGAYWNTPYSQTLTALGGVPQFIWTIVTGALPPGLSLSPDGVISGTPTAAGLFSFTVQATDQVAASAQKALNITTNSDATTILVPEATAHTSKQTPTSNYGSGEENYITGSSAYMYETFQRYNLSGVNLNNGFIKAKLQLYVTQNTPAGTYAFIQGNLIADAQDGWVETGRSVPFETTYANNGANKIRITCFGHGFSTGNLITITGFSATPPNGLWSITKVDNDHFDIPVTYSGAYAIDPALAYATAANINYNNRPTTYNPNVPTVSASGYPVAGTILEMDVTPFVAETLAHDPAKLMSVRLFTTNTQTVYVASRHAYGAAIPRLIIETSDAPAISVSSPSVNPAYVYLGSGLKINATATAIPARAGSLSLLWSKVSGPGTVTFSSATVDSPTVTFSAIGSYVLRLTASDGVLQSTRDITVVVLSPNAGGTAPTTGPSDSLLVRLPLDESSGITAADYSGISPANTITLKNWGASGNATWSPAGGKIGGAISFNGNNQFVEIADTTTHPLDGMQKMSISCWAKLNADITDGKNHVIAAKRATTSSGSTSYSLVFTSSRHINASIGIAAGAALSDFISPVNEWVHIAMVFDGALSTNNIQLYINGIPDKFGTQALTSVPRNTASTSKLRIGDYLDAVVAQGVALNGIVDEFRLYNRVLTLDEIQALAQGKPSNLGPVISLAGPVSAYAGQSFALNATVTDDGLPGPLQYGWFQVSGPGSVNFANPAIASTSATASQDGSYTLRLTASDGAITTFADLAANITLTAYQQWLKDNGLPVDGSGSGAPMATPLGDGVTNAMKYALGIAPNVQGYGGHVATGKVNESGQDYLSLTYITPEPAPLGVTYAVKTNSDLGTWSAVDTQLVSSTVNGGLRTTVVRDTHPMTEQKRFIRLEVVVP